MTVSSYSDVFSISHDREHHEEIRPGDIVSAGQNHYPRYEVVAVHGDKAWVRNILNGTDALTLLSRCRKIEETTLLHAAE